MKPLIPLALIATTGLASADTSPEQKYGAELSEYYQRTEELKQYYRTREKLTPAACNEAIVKAKAAGVRLLHDPKFVDHPKRQPVDPYSSAIPIEDAPPICAEFKKWHQIGAAYNVLDEAGGMLEWLAMIDVATNHEDNQAKLGETAKRCTSELDRLIAAGMPTDIEVTLQGKSGIKLTLAEGKAKICEPLAKAAGTFAKDVRGARQARFDELAAPYKKVGIKGDRLDFLVDKINFTLRGIGGVTLSTPKQLKAAKVIFYMLGPNSSDGSFTVRRVQFKGDKIVGDTEQQYWRKPGAGAYR